MIFNQLREFCQRLYDTLGNARDTLFDGMDAVLVSGCIVSYVSLSQSPVFRRQWPSIYAGLQDSQLPQATVRQLLVSQIATDQQPLLADNATRWNCSQNNERPYLIGRDSGCHHGWPQLQHSSVDSRGEGQLGVTDSNK